MNSCGGRGGGVGEMGARRGCAGVGRCGHLLD